MMFANPFVVLQNGLVVYHSVWHFMVGHPILVRFEESIISKLSHGRIITLLAASIAAFVFAPVS